jgi:putative endopeptidase
MKKRRYNTSRIVKIVLVVFVAVFFISTVLASGYKKPSVLNDSGIFPTMMDTNLNPGDDFYRYTNESWLKLMGTDESFASTKGSQRASDQIDSIIDDPENFNQDFMKIYTKLMNKEQTQADTEAFLAKVKSEIFETNTLDGYLQVAYKYGASPFIVWADRSKENSKKSVLLFSIPGLLISDPKQSKKLGSGNDKDLYLNNGPADKLRRDQIVQLNNEFLGGMGFDTTQNPGQKVLDLETLIATNMKSRSQYEKESRDSFYTSGDDLKQSVHNFSFANFIEKIGGNQQMLSQIKVKDLDYLDGLDKIVNEQNLESLKYWTFLKLVNNYVDDLPNRYREALNNYMVRTGVAEASALAKQSRKDVVRSIITSTFKTKLSYLYTKKFADKGENEGVKDSITNIVNYILAAYRETISAKDWLDESSKQKAIEKIDKMKVRVGLYLNEEPKSYDNLPDGSVIDQLQYINEQAQRDMLKSLDEDFDFDEYMVSTQGDNEVNAFYMATDNSINIPTAFTQYPIYSPSWDLAGQYASVGAVIGHEIGHAFDESGSKYDADGNKIEWMSPESREKFNAQSDVIVKQYDGFQPEILLGKSEAKVDGRFTLGENQADIAGTQHAYLALMKNIEDNNNAGGKLKDMAADYEIGGYSPAQRFFIKNGQLWAVKAGYEDQLRRLEGSERDSHSPASIRVNKVLSNVDAWYDAFNIKPTDKLYIPKEQRVNIW